MMDRPFQSTMLQSMSDALEQNSFICCVDASCFDNCNILGHNMVLWNNVGAFIGVRSALLREASKL